MPPSRRQTRTTPPTRRPRVAGLRRPDTQRPEPDLPPHEADEPQTEPEVIDTEVIDTEVTDTEVIDTGAEPEPIAPAGGVIGAAAPAAGAKPSPGRVELDEERPVPAARPAGKRRSIGITQPGDLAEAEAEVAGTEPGPAQRRRVNPLALAIGLIVLALLLGGLAVWFRGEADRRVEAADTNNAALTDPGAAVEVTEKLRTAIERTFSFNYTDLDSTEKAVRENLAGKAACEYDQLFGEVRKLAPEQKIVVSAQVRDIGLIRLEGDKAQALVFLDQRSTRGDNNQAAVSGAQFTVNAERQDGQWKITGFDLLGQPLAGGKPAPQC
ncbi:hypothetical protein [Actinophytocola sp.]|uniref:hypothetical protein n=1 Tax=Actinophytocola sp. TaxID=1872138 RepID=UPI002D7E6AE5|nr:hypothetical protein [Actinophytocola sp.]HET9142278.1 hypothetical protein [Actinophytocola sp.]